MSNLTPIFGNIHLNTGVVQKPYEQDGKMKKLVKAISHPPKSLKF